LHLAPAERFLSKAIRSIYTVKGSRLWGVAPAVIVQRRSPQASQASSLVQD
jgi:hypothetical protein